MLTCCAFRKRKISTNVTSSEISVTKWKKFCIEKSFYLVLDTKSFRFLLELTNSCPNAQQVRKNMKSMSVIEFRYPLNFLFKITTFSNDFTTKDASGKTMFYEKEKIFKRRDHIKVVSDESKKEVMYDFISNNIIGFQQTFTMTNAQKQVGRKVRKKTFRSFINATYHLQD